MTDAPRITPLPSDEQEPRTQELLASLRFDPDAEDMNLFATLARHPRLLKRWSQFGGLLLAGGTLPARDREILILRTAANCGTDYEWAHHLPMGEAAGLTAAEMEALAGPREKALKVDEPLVKAADELHIRSVVSTSTWRELVDRYDEEQLIELCMLVGQYHLVAFTLRSLGVQLEEGLEGLPA
ncbi:carboxymuconolactone decarboxylase family protein [Aquihabitans sp. McL0605]|uniref:carboxymuconolactone decarboxylase family protein n=1 Tax=Aquihabitans sp. McL0605 TaxID=3415671 RepID=UPI003CF64146